MQLYIASDHAGFELKVHLLKYIEGLGHTVIDKGPFAYDERDDYPDFVRPVAEEILKNPNNTRGIVIGKTGEGEAIAVNRFKGIRATVYYGGAPEVIRLSREHNNSNILSLGAGFLSTEEAEPAVKLWLETSFSEAERHTKRINKLDESH